MLKAVKFILATVILSVSSFSHAWEPKKPIIAYVGYAPGSGNELSFRGVAAEVERQTGARFVIINVPGVDGLLSVNKSHKEPADGYSLNATGGLITYTLNEVFNLEAMTWTVNDLYPIIGTANSPQCIIAHTSSPINDVKDLVKQFQNPNRNINVGLGSYAQYMLYGMIMSSGNGNSNKVKSIMYKGPAQALQDVASGNVEIGMVPLSVAAQMINGGKVKLIGLSGDRKIAQYPDAQIVKDVLPGVVVLAMWNITLPKDTPKEIVNWYVNSFTSALNSENVKKYFHDNYMTRSDALTPEAQRKEIAEIRNKMLPIALKLKRDLATN
jgi:tripartite-type tricarboxylate transporter receptor subunit TctC